tara:strand:+ start:112 stop:435 length:324 start_codon:yes stop_codon:yes gene_type:complete
MYQARWKAALELWREISGLCEDGRFCVRWDDNIGSVLFEDDGIYWRVDNIRFVLFENDKSRDHGLHTTVAVYREDVLARIHVCSRIDLQMALTMVRVFPKKDEGDSA